MFLLGEPKLSSCISAQKGHDPQLSLALGMVAKTREVKLENSPRWFSGNQLVRFHLVWG